MFAADSLRSALNIVGTLLADRGQTAEIVVIGGGDLLLANWIARPTKDLDVVATVEDRQYRTAEPLPEPLREAVADTAQLLGLDPRWLNAGPTDQLKRGHPDGFRERTTTLVFGGLTVHVAGRLDQICLKVFAAADHDPRSKHVADLIALAPSPEELRRASVWVKDQDSGDEFKEFVDAVIAHVEAALGAR